MIRIKRFFPVVLSMVTLGAALFLSLSADQGSPTAGRARDSVPRLSVKVSEVREAGTGRGVRLSGTTRAGRRARVSFQVGGRLLSRPVDLGDSFRAGDLLARIDSRQFDHAVAGARARLTELEVRLTLAESQRGRTIRLMEKNAATLEEMEHVDAEVDALTAAALAADSVLQEAVRAAAETTIVAPFDGIVSQVFLEPGEFASPGRQVLQLSGTEEVEIRVEVPEGMLEWVTAGRELPVWFPGLNRQRTGVVRSVGRASTGQGRLFPVIISLPSTDWLIPGLSSEVEVSNPALEGLLVPLAAIRKSSEGGTTVWRVRSGRVEQLPVSLASFSGDQVVVLGNLEAGDQVVVEHPTGLVDGEEVEVKR